MQLAAARDETDPLGGWGPWCRYDLWRWVDKEGERCRAGRLLPRGGLDADDSRGGLCWHGAPEDLGKYKHNLPLLVIDGPYFERLLGVQHEIAMGTRSDGKEPPFLLGDGMNLWPYISGAIGNSTRTEMVHEAHTHGSTDGNGNALRVGDWKIVLRTGGQWSTGSHFVSSHKRSVFVCDVGIYSDRSLLVAGIE